MNEALQVASMLPTRFTESEAAHGALGEWKKELLLLAISTAAVQQVGVQTVVDGEDDSGAGAVWGQFFHDHGECEGIQSEAGVGRRHTNAHQAQRAELLYLTTNRNDNYLMENNEFLIIEIRAQKNT